MKRTSHLIISLFLFTQLALSDGSYSCNEDGYLDYLNDYPTKCPGCGEESPYYVYMLTGLC